MTTVDRNDPPWSGDEKTMLIGWLRYHRATLAMKCDGLTPEQLCRRSVPPSELSLLGLVRHMTEVERNWFRRVLDDQAAEPLYYSDDDPDGDVTNAAPDGVESALAVWRSECGAVDAIVDAHDLDDTGTWGGVDEPVSMRWIMIHLVEEYARHNGHADFLRERIDGATGD